MSDNDMERRLVIARALAMEHGLPLGFHEEEDQLDWDRKAQAVLRELDALNPSPPPPDLEGERLADGSRPYPKSSDSALPAPSTEAA